MWDVWVGLPSNEPGSEGCPGTLLRPLSHPEAPPTCSRGRIAILQTVLMLQWTSAKVLNRRNYQQRENLDLLVCSDSLFLGGESSQS